MILRLNNLSDEYSAAYINALCELVHKDSKKWWTDIKTGEPLNRNFGEMIALVHSELSEALEAHRKDLMDDKLPHRKGVDVELADALIRIFDIAGGLNIDLGRAVMEKMFYNRNREDHKIENRLKEGGKKY